MVDHPIRIHLAEGTIEAVLETPEGPHRLVDLAFQVLELSSVAAEMGARAADREGTMVTCNNGCGACCRQLVPVSPPEAVMLLELVESLEEPRKSTIQHRFAQAVDQLERSGVLEKLEDPGNPLLYKAEEAYFLQKIPCPFLENESCGIYPSRPSRCREYLVFTPPERCADPYRNRIGRLPVSMHLNEALAWLWSSMSGQAPRYIPLTLALKWTTENQKIQTMSADPKGMIGALCGHIENISRSVERKALRKSGKPGKSKKKKRKLKR